MAATSSVFRFYEKLAKVVNFFFCLQDQFSADFKDSEKKEQAWKDVAEAIVLKVVK